MILKILLKYLIIKMREINALLLMRLRRDLMTIFIDGILLNIMIYQTLNAFIVDKKLF